MPTKCVHIVSLGVKNFENKTNSRQLQSESQKHQKEVYDYVQESLGGDFKQFQPADNDTHWCIFMHSFFQHYSEFSGHPVEVFDLLIVFLALIINNISKIINIRRNPRKILAIHLVSNAQFYIFKTSQNINFC